MKKLLLSISFSSITVLLFAQKPKEGKAIYESILAATVKTNKGGENPVRSVVVYLPPGYENSSQRFPVIYYLHGFQNTDTMFITGARFDKLMDDAIASGRIRPAILVIPNEYTVFKGSFYTNSPVTGNWEDFTTKELVDFIDKKYRTIPDRNSRGLAGISMGGYGAIKLGMLHPDVFGCIYAESPAILAMGQDFTIYHPSIKTAQQATTKDEVFKDDLTTAWIAMGRAFSPNPAKPPFYCDLPVTYEENEIVVNYDAVQNWEKNLPINMIDNHIKELRSLNAIKIDWGRNDENTHIPVSSLLFSQKLEALGIVHEAEIYNGDHSHLVWGKDGRWYTELLPFFNRYLSFEVVGNN